MCNLRLSGEIPESVVDGIGIRYTIFFQGCDIHCYKCQNPQTWDFNGGYLKSVSDVIKDVQDTPLATGVTFTGGEALLQTQGLLELSTALKGLGYNLWLYSGRRIEVLERNPEYLKVLRVVDVLVDGAYVHKLRTLSLPFRGSSNQRIIDLRQRYG